MPSSPSKPVQEAKPKADLKEIPAIVEKLFFLVGEIKESMEWIETKAGVVLSPSQEKTPGEELEAYSPLGENLSNLYTSLDALHNRMKDVYSRIRL